MKIEHIFFALLSVSACYANYAIHDIYKKLGEQHETISTFTS
jgi:hypothetical protein